LIPDLSLLGVASAMSRHAGHVHDVTARNIAAADAPGTTRLRAASFAEAVGRADEALAPASTRERVVLDDEMLTMARNAGRHDAAVTLWAKTLDMVRLAASSPR
jgi:flagellar basal body rod protein FlgB